MSLNNLHQIVYSSTWEIIFKLKAHSLIKYSRFLCGGFVYSFVFGPTGKKRFGEKIRIIIFSQKKFPSLWEKYGDVLIMEFGNVY